MRRGTPRTHQNGGGQSYSVDRKRDGEDQLDLIADLELRGPVDAPGLVTGRGGVSIDADKVARPTVSQIGLAREREWSLCVRWAGRVNMTEDGRARITEYGSSGSATTIIIIIYQ